MGVGDGDVDRIEVPCPLCGEGFADDDGYAAHLADAHDLHDDQGVRTTLEAAVISAGGVVPDHDVLDDAGTDAAGDEGHDPATAADRTEDPEGRGRRRRRLVVGMLILLFVAGASVVVAAGGTGDDETGGDTAADVLSDAAGRETRAGGVVPASTTLGVGGGDGTAAAATTPPPTTSTSTSPDSTPARPDGTATSVPPTTAAPVSSTAPPTTGPPTTGSPTTAPPTTAPPTTATPTTAAGYVAPSATSPRVESCTRTGSTTTWRFSYVLSGGSGWSPSPGATSLGGGRYAEDRTTHGNDGLTVTSVQVVDSAGGNRSVPLQPSLVTDRCT